MALYLLLYFLQKMENPSIVFCEANYPCCLGIGVGVGGLGVGVGGFVRNDGI